MTRGPLHFQRTPDDDALQVLDSNLHSARLVLLTINVICGFLFLMVCELVFGWQAFRPSASNYIFCDRLAVLASAAEGEGSTFERGLILLARKRVNNILGVEAVKQANANGGADSLWVPQPWFGHTRTDSPTTVDSLRRLLITKTKSLRIWEAEEHLRGFVRDYLAYEKGVSDAVGKVTVASESSVKSISEQRGPSGGYIPVCSSNATSVSFRTLLLVHGADPAILLDPVTVTDTVSTRAHLEVAARDIPNATLAFSLQEILDRHRVNETTRGRRVAPRAYEFPVIGTATQVEDINLPVAAFLILLSHWLYTSLRRAYDAARSYLRQLPPTRPLSKMAELQYLSLFNRFQFLFLTGKRKEDTVLPRRLQYDRGMLWLTMPPYLVVASSIMANLHETVLLDARSHGATFHLSSAPIVAFTTFDFLLVSAAVYLAIIAYRAKNAFLEAYLSARIKWSGFRDEKRLRVRLAPLVRSSSSVSQGWIAAAPFVIFGSLTCLSTVQDRFLYDYFLGWDTMWVFLLVVAVYTWGLMQIMRRRPNYRARFVANSLIFALIPVLMLALALDVSTTSRAVGISPISIAIPPALSGLAIVACGLIYGVYQRRLR